MRLDVALFRPRSCLAKLRPIRSHMACLNPKHQALKTLGLKPLETQRPKPLKPNRKPQIPNPKPPTLNAFPLKTHNHSLEPCQPFGKSQVSRVMFGDTVLPYVEQDCILLLGIVFYIREITLVGSTTKTIATQVRHPASTVPRLVAAEGCVWGSLFRVWSFIMRFRVWGCGFGVYCLCV